MGKIEYIRCPRCELNYIIKKEKLCKVCQSELKAKGSNALSDEEALEMGLCPVCKNNYITDDEDICVECLKEQQMQNDQLDTNTTDGDDQDDNWRMYVDNEDTETEEDEFGDMSSIEEADMEADDIIGEEDLNLDDEDEFEDDIPLDDDYDDIDDDYDSDEDDDEDED